MRGFVRAAVLLLTTWMALFPFPTSAQQEDSLLWSQRHESEYTAPEMFVTELFNVYQVIWDAFEAQGWPISYRVALQVAVCESGLNPQAHNTASGAAGLYQFMPATWQWAALNAGYGGRSRYDPVANANTAAWLMARPHLGGMRHWRSCAVWF